MDPILESETQSFDYFLGDFVDFAENTPSGVPDTELLPLNRGSTLLNGRSASLLIPSVEHAATAKKVWLPIIRRCTEAVPETKSRLRPLEASQPNRGRIHIEYQRLSSYGKLSGYELDISDKMCLLLFSRTDPQSNGVEHNGVIEASIPILWTEIANIRFEVEHPVTRTAPGAQEA
jgi:hypothetical protein